MHVLLPSDHLDAPATSSVNGLSKLLVFETVVDGGFGNVLKLEEGATLELDRFEDVASPPPSASSSPDPSTSHGEDSSAVAAAVEHSRQARRRFTHFHFRTKRSHNHSVSGPALAVVDAEPTHHQDTKKDDEGVRVTIRLAALDAEGTELSCPNEQVTYLHVVRFGAKSEDSAEDSRPWVVKVVKREATVSLLCTSYPPVDDK